MRRTLVFALSLASVGACSPPAPKGDRPSVLLISVDSLRFDHLHCYGYPRETSPTIDALAASGVRVQTAISSTAWTLPSHASIFTGLYDSAHGLIDNGLALADSQVTLAETMKAAGYHTVGFFGGPYLHPTYGLGKGFEIYKSCMTAFADDVSAEKLRHDAAQSENATHADVTSPRTLDEITKWAQNDDDARPFFAFVHMWDVHYDYIPPKEYVERFDPGYSGHLDVHDYVDNPAIKPDMDPRDFQHLLALYDGEIRYTDEYLGRILDVIKKKAGGDEKLLVVFVADHGDAFFDHGLRGHANTLFDELVHVPMLMSWPGHLPKNVVFPQQVRTIDVFPSIAARAGAEIPRQVQGRDVLGAILAKQTLPPEPAMSELFIGTNDFRSLRGEHFKVMASISKGDLGGFDLDRDPREQNALPANDPRLAKLFAKLHELSQRSDALRRELKGDPKTIEVQSDMQKRLKSLGY